MSAASKCTVAAASQSEDACFDYMFAMWVSSLHNLLFWASADSHLPL